jgi:hypothetical protein
MTGGNFCLNHKYLRSCFAPTNLGLKTTSNLSYLLTIMGQLERLVMMAEDQLTEYSTTARKIEKLRRKIGLSVPVAEQRKVKAQLIEEMPTDLFSRIVEHQRQTVALPFWGIAGLGLLFGISMTQPLDFIATGVGGFIAIKVQQMGWKLQAKRLVIQTLEEIEKELENPMS